MAMANGPKNLPYTTKQAKTLVTIDIVGDPEAIIIFIIRPHTPSQTFCFRYPF